MSFTPIYDPELSYEENFKQGPFGAFRDKQKFLQKGDPKYDFLGFPVFLPFGIPSGPLVNGTFVKAALDKGFDLCIYKTVRSVQYSSHPWPNVLSLNIKGDLTEKRAQRGVIGHHNFTSIQSITNSFGVPSFSPDFWQKDLADCVKYAKKGQLVIGSFQGTINHEHNNQNYIEDFVTTAKLVKETGVKVMEVNLSCPNEGHSNLLCFDVEKTQLITSKIKNVIGNIPLILKISYFHNTTQLEKLIKAVKDTAQGFATINTLSAKIIDENGNKILPGNGRETSGVCGSAIKWAGLEMVKKLSHLRKTHNMDFVIIGVGGVMNANDYFEYRNMGADAVMSATGAMWNPYLAQEIKAKVLKDE